MHDLPFLSLLFFSVMVVLLTTAGNPRLRPVICVVTGMATAAYVFWRYHSIAMIDLAPPEQVWWVKFCFWGEVIFVGEFWIFLLLTSRTSDHRETARRYEQESRDGRSLPRVDVFITTYDEELPILEKSICGALALDWPDFDVYVLDDGRRAWLAEYCATVGAVYVTRPDNKDKKAGNHNHALSITSAPFVAVFDADFVPNQNFLRKTIGFFEDEGIGIVQTPQVFYNKDSFQNSLRMHNVITDDQRFFFRHVMSCRDAWNVAFYVGSSAVLRRKAIESIGGIVTKMATEDQATSVALLTKGYRTLYLNEPLSSGLAPESSYAMIEQRKRWCRGGIQLAFRRFGPFGPDLKSLKDRLFFIPNYWVLGYLNAAFFLLEATGCWYLGFTPFVSVNPVEIFIGSLATFTIYSAFLVWVGRGTWMPIVSPAFHLFMAFAVVPTAWTTLLKPWGKPLLSFVEVTPKGQTAQKTRINDAALWPLLVAIVILGFGVISSVFFPLSLRVNPGENLVLSVWTAVMFTQLFFALLACVEPPYRRAEERFVRKDRIEVCDAGTCVIGQLEDISLTGARISGSFIGQVEVLHFAGVDIPVTVLRADNDELRLQFGQLDVNSKRKLIEYLFTISPPEDPAEASPLQAVWATLMRLLHGSR